MEKKKQTSIPGASQQPQNGSADSHSDATYENYAAWLSNFSADTLQCALSLARFTTVEADNLAERSIHRMVGVVTDNTSHWMSEARAQELTAESERRTEAQTSRDILSDFPTQEAINFMRNSRIAMMIREVLAAVEDQGESASVLVDLPIATLLGDANALARDAVLRFQAHMETDLENSSQVVFDHCPSCSAMLASQAAKIVAVVHALGMARALAEAEELQSKANFADADDTVPHENT